MGGFNSSVELLVAMRRAQWISGQPVQKGQKAVTSPSCSTSWFWTGLAFLTGFTCGAVAIIIVIFFHWLLSE